MNRLNHALLAFAVVSGASIPAAAAERLDNPLRFFEGRTETVGVVKVMTKKPFRSRSIGRGEIKPDGTLELVQRVEDEGRPPRDRRWKIRQVAPHRYLGTMSEAKGPVIIEEIGGRYRFRFRMKGDLSVEQWLSPLAGWKSARNKVIIRKLGVAVAQSEGMIRKLQ